MILSIVIPTLNRPNNLVICLQALHAECRGAADIECIVIDDGSTVHEAAANETLCRNHAVRYIHQTHNRGMAVARNCGIASATGTWVMFLDDDIRVNSGWIATLRQIIDTIPDGAIGFEGCILPSGDGVWDREVHNSTGGLYLTSHSAYRKTTLNKLGGFNPGFEFKGPFCEDQELAARAQLWGSIPFFDELIVTHQPRSVKLVHYILAAPKRCTKLLAAEYYFFTLHPDRYHQFRVHQTFWGTYRSILIRNLLNNVRRRTLTTLLHHPVQTTALILGSILEQFTAWTVLPRYILSMIQNHPLPFLSSVDRD